MENKRKALMYPKLLILLANKQEGQRNATISQGQSLVNSSVCAVLSDWGKMAKDTSVRDETISNLYQLRRAPVVR